jgi:hypothetical protein
MVRSSIETHDPNEPKETTMNKLLIAAGAVIAGLLVAGPSTAEAASRNSHVDARIHVDSNRGHYRPYARPHHRPVVRHVLPRRHVIHLMQRQGYRDCRGWQVYRGVYSLRCVRHGRVFAVRVNGWTGQIIGRHRIG